MGKNRKELTHEEVWDDSGLIDSWNASYEEYKVRPGDGVTVMQTDSQNSCIIVSMLVVVLWKRLWLPQNQRMPFKRRPKPNSNAMTWT